MSSAQALRANGVDLMADAPATGTMNTVLTLNTHIGTHIDAPRHFFADGGSCRQLAAGPSGHARCRGARRQQQAGRRRSARPTISIEPASYSARGQVAVIKTLWTNRAWGKPEFWHNTIYLDPSVGELDRRARSGCRRDGLLSGKALLADAADARGTRREPQAMAEGWNSDGSVLTNLDQIGNRFALIALPLRLTGMDGSPARVVGVRGLENTKLAANVICVEPIAPCNRFKLHADGVHDGNDGPRFEYEGAASSRTCERSADRRSRPSYTRPSRPPESQMTRS